MKSTNLCLRRHFLLPGLLFVLLSILFVLFMSDARIFGYSISNFNSAENSPVSLLNERGVTSAGDTGQAGITGTPQVSAGIDKTPASGAAFKSYVTPDDPVIRILAARINRPEEAYSTAVQWTYVSEKKLNNAVDKWLTPQEFLLDTPNYSGNPLQGTPVSDCEEKANALASLIRAIGIPAEEVRVVIGKVSFNKVETGHAWVEMLIGNRWQALDPNWGPYWDDEEEKLVRRDGMAFDYYRQNEYPVLRVWAYYNDIYYYVPGTDPEDVPDSWEQTIWPASS